MSQFEVLGATYLTVFTLPEFTRRLAQIFGWGCLDHPLDRSQKQGNFFFFCRCVLENDKQKMNLFPFLTFEHTARFFYYMFGIFHIKKNLKKNSPKTEYSWI